MLKNETKTQKQQVYTTKFNAKYIKINIIMTTTPYN